MKPLHYGQYTITKQVGEKAFELNLPPYPIFNVELLKPYYPRMFDTSTASEQLEVEDINPDGLAPEKEHIVDQLIIGYTVLQGGLSWLY